MRTLRDWKKGNKFSASHLQEPVDALRELDSRQGYETPAADYRRAEMWPAVIAAKDPAGAASAYTDSRYWVTRKYIAGGLQNDLVVLNDDIQTGVDRYTPDPYVFTATNLAELSTASPPTDTHLLQAGQPVFVFAWFDKGDPQRKHYLFWEMVGGGEQVIINSNDTGGAKYVGQRYVQPTSDIAASGNLAASDLGTASGPNIRIVNPAEAGQATHLLKTGTVHNAHLIRVNTDGTQVWQIDDMPTGNTASPTTLGDGTVGVLAADTSSWTRSSTGTPLDVWVQTRTFWDGTGNVIYAYLRKISIDACGLVIAATGETRVSVDATTAC